MNLTIFGATGSVGRHLVEQALKREHEVTAFARDPSAIATSHPKLTLHAGDVLDPAAVAAALEGRDAALITLGSRSRKGTLRSAGTRHVVDGMRRHAVERLVCQTTLGCGDSWNNLDFFWKRIMFGWLIKDVLADHERQEGIVRASGLDWVIVRPAAFTNEPGGHGCRHGFAAAERGLALKVPRADVADFMLRQLGEDGYLHRAPGLSR